jgi:penicillin-binding protein 1C
MKLRFITSFIILILGLGIFFYSQINIVTDFNQFKKLHTVSDHYLFSSDGRLLSQIRIDKNKKNLNWFPLQSLNSKFIQAALKQEDHRFFYHHGVDFISLGRAFVNFMNLSSQVRQGGSTITMQLAKNLKKLKTRQFSGKISQILTAWKLENHWSKSQILEAYLNTSYFYGEIQGLGTASILLFKKSPEYLTLDEQTLLLALLKSPNSKKVLTSRVDLISHSSNKLPEKPFENLAEHYHYFLIKNKKTETHSNIDYDLQKTISEIVDHQLIKLKDKNVHDVAVIVLDNKNNSVIAYQGSSGKNVSQAPYVDMAQAKRQMGSTLKPFLYATALDKKLIDLNSWILDSPVDIVFTNGTYSPRNHDHTHHGWIKVGMALGSSLNVPAVKTIQLLGVDQFWKILYDLGFSLKELPDYYGPSLSLGVLDGSLWQLTHAYQKMSQINDDIFSLQVKKKMKWMLSRSQNRALSFGQDSILTTAGDFAVKTGTSKDMKDNWCIGYNDDFTVGVWVGNADNSSMMNVIGVTGAAPIWRQTVDYLMSRSSPVNRNISNNMNQNKRPHILVSAKDEENFLAIESTAQRPDINESPRILSPASNSIFAIDPGIPLENQKIILQATGNQKNLFWKKDGSILNEKKLSLSKGWQKIELYEGNTKKDQSVFLVK